MSVISQLFGCPAWLSCGCSPSVIHNVYTEKCIAADQTHFFTLSRDAHMNVLSAKHLLLWVILGRFRKPDETCKAVEATSC